MWQERFRRLSGRMLAMWEAETRQQLSVARVESPLVIRNALPTFMERIADALTEGPMEVAGPSAQISVSEAGPLESSGSEHGRQRAEQTNYSLAAVATECQVLRRVIFRVLEQEQPDALPARVRDRILDCVDAGIRHAMVEYSRITTDLLNSHIAALEVERGLREAFVSRLTHDLRNPLFTISTASELVSSSPDRETCARLMPRILGNVRRMDGMITDLLDANRIRAGEHAELRLESMDLVTVVTAAISDNELPHGKRFLLRAPAQVLGTWSADGLRRVIDNLLSNAVKYGSHAAPITVTVVVSDAEATLSVHNLGPTIPQADRAAIFEAFQRSGSRGDAASWGVGLAVVKHVVEQHGGSITVESADGVGTTFVVRLPRDPRHSARPDVRSGGAS